MKSFFTSSKFILVIIIVLSFFLRTYKISDNPPSLNWDEVSHGYNAYSILKTGKDEWGIKFPLIFRAYGDYKLPLYIYLTAVSELFFGLNSFSIRLISALSGTGLVVLAYLITKKLTKNSAFSLIAAFLTSVTPWGLFLSRVAVEANLGAFLFALGLYLLIWWLTDHRQRELALAALFWGLSLHAYNSARVLVPVFMVLTTMFVIKEKKGKQLLMFFLILLIFWLPIVGQFFNRSGTVRFEWVSLIDQGKISQIIQKRETSTLPKTITRAVYNRPTFFVFYALRNYFVNLSPKYLFFRGGSHYQFSLPNHELLYLVAAPFLLLGLIKILIKGNKEERLIGLWFFASFIPSAITKDAPHVLRSILVLPSPMILTALGLQLTVNFLKGRSKFGGKLLIFVLTLAVFVSFGRWWNDYSNIYPKAYSWSWQYGYKEVVSYIKSVYEKYDKIFFTKRYGEPHEFILFYFPWDPGKYQEDPNKKWDFHANWYWIDGFDKFEFINDWEIQEVVNKPIVQNTKYKILLITSPGNYPEEWNKLKMINYLDEKPVFEILEK